MSLTNEAHRAPSSIVCAVLMCHAPIVIPAIAGDEARSCSATTQAMRSTAQALVAHEPDVIVLISPHAPRRADSIGVVFEEQLRGDFSRFRHPELALSVRGAPSAAQLLASHAQAHDVATHFLPGHALDHGSTVPLFFVHEAGYRGRVLLLSLPYPGGSLERRLGVALAEAAAASGERWAILASGDMSHRLSRSAPAGFDPRAQEFDAAFVSAVRDGDLRRAVAPDPALAELAAQDVVQSTEVAAAALQYRAQGTRVFAYEAPFGVGYLEALLFSDRDKTDLPAPERPPVVLAEIALAAIHHALRGEPYAPPSLPAPWDQPRAVFVTLRSPDGELRGCIGRTEPSLPQLADEVADCAVSAATRDYRMPSVRSSELASLRLEVSVLHPPAPIADARDLDPARFGVVVEHGKRRGVLLPAIDGIDTVEKQLQIALHKAGIEPNAPYQMQRFLVDKVSRDPEQAGT